VPRHRVDTTVPLFPSVRYSIDARLRRVRLPGCR
jgi:hypothetical protein